MRANLIEELCGALTSHCRFLFWDRAGRQLEHERICLARAYCSTKEAHQPSRVIVRASPLRLRAESSFARF